MHQILNSPDLRKEKSDGLPYPLTRNGAVVETNQAEQLTHDLQERASVIGPILEEILQSHWEHWGLND